MDGSRKLFDVAVFNVMIDGYVKMGGMVLARVIYECYFLD
jgi:hypothetical protein